MQGSKRVNCEKKEMEMEIKRAWRARRERVLRVISSAENRNKKRERARKKEKY